MSRRIQFSELDTEYKDLWQSLVVRNSWRAAIEKSAARIVAHRARYEAVAAQCGTIPWFMVGLIHQMESGQRWDRHLHNGDSLSRRTVRVPANRPKTGRGPFTWEESALDALRMKGFHKITEWTLPRIAYELERYNGFGYRLWHPTTLSPYLWSGSTHYRRGKYVADGKWSSSAVSRQTGAMVLLRQIMDTQPDVLEQFRPLTPPIAEPVIAEAETQADDFVPTPAAAPVREAAKNSGTIFGGLMAAFGAVVSWFEDAAEVLVSAAGKATEWKPATELVASLGGNVDNIAFAITIGGVAWAIARRLNAAHEGKIG